LQRALDRLRGDPAYQSFTLLRIGFTVLPIAFGADRFANLLVNWERYLVPWMAHLSALSSHFPWERHEAPPSSFRAQRRTRTGDTFLNIGTPPDRSYHR
jgi:hypothetical protein